MKAYVRTISKMIEDYTNRKDRMMYLVNENAQYSKMLSTLDMLETSDDNESIKDEIKNAFKHNSTFIEIYKSELAEIEEKIEDVYNSEISYSAMYVDDVNAIVRTMRENVKSDIDAGYSIEKITQELKEIDNYKATKENEYRELTAMPNVNERMFATLVNKGAIDLI